MIRGINHIGIAVRDLAASMELFGTIFRVDSFHRERVEDQKVEVASFNLGGVLIELTAPTEADSTIGKFLEKRGEGIHHVAFAADDVNAELDRLNGAGISLINRAAQQGAHDMLIAFLHPTSTGGVLMELCQHNDRTD